MTTIGVFTTHASARAAIDDLRTMGVSDTDISYLYTNIDGDIKDGHSDSKLGEGTSAGATAGAVLGAIAGFAVANLVLPGVGTLLVAGPIATALGLTGVAASTAAGAMTGLAAGGLIGALVNLRESKPDRDVLLLVAPKTAVERVFGLVGIDRVFRIAPSEEGLAAGS